MKAVKDALQRRLRRRAVARACRTPTSRSSTTRPARSAAASRRSGMDVHPGCKLEPASACRRPPTSCAISSRGSNASPAAAAAQIARPILRPARGTGFTLVTDHIPEFAKRGMCARDPQARARRRHQRCAMPRKPPNGDEFKPYSPAGALPYAHRWRLFRTPNDAFLTANTHREGMSLFDILQPAYAAFTAARSIRPRRRTRSSPIRW